MEYVIIALIVFSAISFVYDQILLPSIRQSIRSNIFELRDELRDHLIENKSKFNKETVDLYVLMDDRINQAVNKLHLLTFVNFVRAVNATQDSLHEVEAFRARLDNCVSPVPREVHDKLIYELKSSLAANSLIFILSILPLIILGYLIGIARDKARKAVKDLGDLVTNDKDDFQGSMFG